jgi:hypothetical protein
MKLFEVYLLLCDERFSDFLTVPNEMFITTMGLLTMSNQSAR